ncbi:hypothetical protein M422DRAFT_27235 [Sphaerobolus stellatus SS14]|nr:hypothetical protein M422DRAFT_27235 [Sphaerobolus stellatus SS14]
MAKIRGGFVVVVGCGGVGSHAAVMLVRSGVAKIRLVDFDYVTLSSLNRHAAAGLSDVGTPKVTCIKKDYRKLCEVGQCRCEGGYLEKGRRGGNLLEGADWVVASSYGSFGG